MQAVLTDRITHSTLHINLAACNFKMKIIISSAVNKELIFSRTPNYKNASFQWFRLLHNLRPDSRWQLEPAQCNTVTVLQCYTVATWFLLSRRPSRDKSGDRWETRRTSSQPQHRQDDQGSGENIVFFFPFLSLLHPCILCFSVYIYTGLLLNTFPSALLFICLLSPHSLLTVLKIFYII